MGDLAHTNCQRFLIYAECGYNTVKRMCILSDDYESMNTVNFNEGVKIWVVLLKIELNN